MSYKCHVEVIAGRQIHQTLNCIAVVLSKLVSPPFDSLVFLITLSKFQPMLKKVHLLRRMSAHLRVTLSSLLLELASCIPRDPVPSGDLGRDGDGLPISSENAAVIDIVGGE